MNYSTTYIGAIVSFLAFLAKIFNVELPFTSEEIEKALIVIAGIIGFIITLYGRFKNGGINWTGTKVSGRRTVAPGEKVQF